MSRTIGRAGPLALVAALAALLVVGAIPVLAHAELVSSDPADGAQLADPPTTVTLVFSEGLDASRSSFRLNRDGANVGVGSAASNGDTELTLTGLALEPGDYLIRWTSAADDGHLERGQLTFTVLAPTATPEPTAPPAASPTVTPTDDVIPSPTASGTTVPSEPPVTPSAIPSAAPDPNDASGTGSDVILPILLALAIVAGVGAYVLRRSRRA